MLFKGLAYAIPFATVYVHAIDLDVNDPATIEHAGFVVAHGMMQYYSGNQSGQTPGYLPNEGAKDGYYWWEGAGVFGSLIDYWYYTGDTTYNEVVTQAMLWQTGPDRNYQPLNASQTLGNDDIGFWAMSALKAAELNFPDPPPNQPQWIPLAQTVFANYITRWDPLTCNGGLRWQVFLASSGYSYKNSVSNGAMFNIGARLGKYSGNQTYLDWAEKVYDWTSAVGLIDQDNVVQDGTDAPQNCSVIKQHPWTYNQGLYIYGAACMYNVTQDDKWKQRTTDLLDAFNTTFVRSGVVTEIGCQDTNSCNNDEISFKSYALIWLAEVAKVANYTEPFITPILQASAQAAAAQCSGGDDGVTCGMDWTLPTWDGTAGIGQEMAALEAFNALLAKYKAGPLKNFDDGGTSSIDPNAGQTTSPKGGTKDLPPITMADKVGAGILTALLAGATVLGAAWTIIDMPLRTPVAK